MISFCRHCITLLLSILFATTLSAQTNENVIRPKISRIVHKLKKEDEVHFGYPVGFAGTPETDNKYYKLYLKLKNEATDKELCFLTKDKSKDIVVYSFSILYSRQYSNLKNIFLEHLNDTTFFATAGGCTGMLDRVNWYMLRQLKPIRKDGIIDFLTKEEYDLYSDKFKKQDKDFSSN